MTEILNLVFVLAVLFIRQTVWCEHEYHNSERFSLANKTSYRAYMKGVGLGIINVDKYPLVAFQRDEQQIFRDLYAEYVLINESLPLNYEEWLIMNNYGILCDTEESVFQKKITKRSVADNKQRFVNTVRKGDILVTGRGIFGLVGHTAIMASDTWVLEMKGGVGWQYGIKDNNRKIIKDKWFDERSSYWINVYRCKDRKAARQAAVWADHNYYNPSGGLEKTKHITFKITKDMRSTNPSYCSKLVIQAYYFGSGNKKVVKDLSDEIIVPTTIPKYFLSPYTLNNIGKF